MQFQFFVEMDNFFHFNAILSDFVFTGIVYLPLSILLAYIAFLFWKHRQKAKLMYIMFFEMGMLCIITFTGALAGTVFTNNPYGIYLIMVVSSFVLSFSNALLGYLSMYLIRSKVSPWYGFMFILIFGLIVSFITIFENIEPYIEDNGGVNWGMPDYLLHLRSLVYYLGVIPTTIIFWIRFKKEQRTESKKFYFALFLLMIFILAVVATDFNIEPLLQSPALLSELVVIVFILVIMVIYFIFNEVFISRLEKRFKYVIESLQEMVFIVDSSHNVLFCNNAVESVLGYDTSAMAGYPLLNLIHSDDRNFMKRIFSDAEYPGDKIECRLVNVFGDPKWVVAASNLIPIEEWESRMSAYLIAFSEITEIKELQQTLITAKEKAEESDRLKSAFLSNMSHEIRTPLNAIVGFSDLLRDESQHDQKKLYIGRILTESDKLLHLINDVFDAARIQTNQLYLKPNRTNLKKLFSEIEFSSIQILEQNGKKSKLELKVLQPSETATIEITTDKLRLGQILNILINNAVKFTKKGEVEVGYKRHNEDEILFWVKDNGIGIPIEQHTDIFKPFRQGNESYTREFEGAGLGLSLAKSLVKLLNGKIWLESKPGLG